MRMLLVVPNDEKWTVNEKQKQSGFILNASTLRSSSALGVNWCVTLEDGHFKLQDPLLYLLTTAHVP